MSALGRSGKARQRVLSRTITPREPPALEEIKRNENETATVCLYLRSPGSLRTESHTVACTGCACVCGHRGDGCSNSYSQLGPKQRLWGDSRRETRALPGIQSHVP